MCGNPVWEFYKGFTVGYEEVNVQAFEALHEIRRSAQMYG